MVWGVYQPCPQNKWMDGWMDRDVLMIVLFFLFFLPLRLFYPRGWPATFEFDENCALLFTLNVSHATNSLQWLNVSPTDAVFHTTLAPTESRSSRLLVRSCITHGIRTTWCWSILVGGKLVYQYQKKPVKAPRCGDCGATLNGVCRNREILWHCRTKNTVIVDQGYPCS